MPCQVLGSREDDRIAFYEADYMAKGKMIAWSSL
jgi:hypothetical protein